MKTEWDLESAIAMYNVDGWSEGYFAVNSSGNVEARPLKENGGSIDLLAIVDEARARNLSFPLLIRFQDLLRHRVESINRAFQSAISEFDYRNHYRGVFPIKVNQLREVIEEIVDAGEQFHFGLEAGSKPELVAALAMQKDPESLIICNGYKDPAFIRIALLGRKLGKSVIIVAEKLEELEQIIRASNEVGVEPYIGIRACLYSKGSGNWSPSAGENAKFGLDTTKRVAASQIGGAEAEFGVLAAARRPFAGAFAIQASTNANVGLDANFVRCANDLLQFFQFFRDDNDRFAKFAPKQRDANESGIFIAVADDQTLGVFLHGERSNQLRFAACFEPKMKLFACIDNFLDDLAQLIDFNGKNAAILIAIIEFGDRALKCAVD